MADALNEGAASPHDGKGGEHPKDRTDEGSRHFMDQGVVGEEHEHLLSEADVEDHTEQGKDSRQDPGVVHHLLGSLLLPCPDVLTDHGHGGVLDALGYFIDDIVDAHTHAKGCRRHHSCAIDHGIDEEHGHVDKARLDRHRRPQGGDHAHVFAIEGEAFLLEIEAEGFSVAEKIVDREQEGGGLSDDGRPSSACHAPTQDARKQDIQHQIDGGGNSNEQEGALGVSHAAEDCRHHVIACGEDQPQATNDQVIHCHVIGFRGDVHDGEDPVAEENDQRGHNERNDGDKAKEGTNDVIHFLSLFRPQCLGDEDLTAVGKAEADHGDKVDNETALGYGGQPRGAHVFSHDDHIDGAIQYLKGVGRHKGQREPKQLLWNIPFRKILGDAFLFQRVHRFLVVNFLPLLYHISRFFSTFSRRIAKANVI